MEMQSREEFFYIIYLCLSSFKMNLKCKWKQSETKAQYCILIFMWHSGNGKKWLSGAEIRRKVDYRWSWKFRRVVEPVPGLDCDVWYICQNLQSYTSKRVINWAELTFPELIPSKLVLTSLHSAPQPADGALTLYVCLPPFLAFVSFHRLTHNTEWWWWQFSCSLSRFLVCLLSI